MTPPQAHAGGDPAVTVVVPAYNSGAALDAALDSLLAQTVEDIEILVVDDGSERDPVRKVPADPRIVVDRRPVNRGYAAVTNHAVGRARGEWVTFVDADDEVVPTYVERMLHAGREQDADLVIAPIMAVRDGRELGPLRFPVSGPVMPARQAFRHAVRGELVLSQHLLMRRPRPDADLGYTFSDFAWVLRHLARSERVALVHEPLYRYTIHGGSITGTLRPSVLELEQLPQLVDHQIRDLFPASIAQEVRTELEHYVTTQMLHKAAREVRDTALRRSIYARCRARLTVTDVVSALRRGDRVTAASWLLAGLDPSLHSWAYRRYDARKGK